MAVFPLLLSIAVALISVPPNSMAKSIIRLVPFATSGDSTTASPSGLLTEASVEYLASGSVEVKKLNLAAV